MLAKEIPHSAMAAEKPHGKYRTILVKLGIRITSLLVILSVILGILSAPADAADPPEVTVSDRLFLEARVAQFCFTNSHGIINAILPMGDPVMDTTETPNGGVTGPLAGQSLNCRACHLVDEHGATTTQR